MAHSPSPFRPRNFTLGALAVLIAGGIFFANSEDAQREAKLRAGELAGDIATSFALANSGGGPESSADLINVPIEVRKLADNVYQARGVANTQLIVTSEGHVVYDTRLSIQAAKQRRLLMETVPDAPITHVILSHSHQDHAGGTPFWVEDGTQILAHQEYPEEQRYLKDLEDLEDYFWFRNRTLFPFMPENPPKSGIFAYGGVVPTILVDPPDIMRLEQGGIRFEVLPTPGAEGSDNLVLWLPDQRILFSGDFFGPNFPQFPNVFTMRGEKVRKPIEYITSLEQLIELEPEMIVPSHKDPVVGKEQIRSDLIKMRDAVRYVHDGTIAGMNAGTVHQLMEEIVLPPALELPQIHGRVSWAVKSIWEYYSTWFHFDSTTELYAVPASAVRPEIAELAGVDALAERASAHVEERRYVEAIHLLEIATAGDPSHRKALETRKAALQGLLREAETAFRNSYEMDFLNYRIRVTDEAFSSES
jgi:alkyl sulfatase BDS1-like metallo-beta-lactamase superfamily hydrolase